MKTRTMVFIGLIILACISFGIYKDHQIDKRQCIRYWIKKHESYLIAEEACQQGITPLQVRRNHLRIKAREQAKRSEFKLIPPTSCTHTPKCLTVFDPCFDK